MKRFLAVQIGARRNYAIPSILEEAGMLESFYTDLTANSVLGAVVSKYCPTFLKQGLIKNLLSRRLPPNLRNYVSTFPVPVSKYLVRKKLAGYDYRRASLAANQFQIELGQAMIRQGIGRATHLFTMMGEGAELIKFAKENSLSVITEVYIIMSVHSIVKAEQEKFPDFEPQLNPDIVEEAIGHWKDICSLTDWMIAPSEAVRQDLAIKFNFPLERCFVVPYAVHPSWLELENKPIKGRILFVGTAELRKGIHILGMASQKLSHRHYEFRVAGGVVESVRQHELTKNLSFLGRVPRSEIKQEYSQADIFVLPSLAEGSAEVIYEALAAGIPVITTKASGSVVRDGIEGFIISERDSDTLADCIEELVENRELRDHMAAAAKERAKNHTWNAYAKNLLTVLASV